MRILISKRQKSPIAVVFVSSLSPHRFACAVVLFLVMQKSEGKSYIICRQKSITDRVLTPLQSVVDFCFVKYGEQ